ncbi:MFS transporter [Inmirania thermothiophila]|uniref:Sugar phosphate permease n=1 Tax=Inmirania thermothiophila TaxID=1750597 RepID=A0A3N1Y1S9_9GAMM|nr:MFS transporter [Inmirania thermothiophila]ROR32776.1 sugar phosphate permease [Inmirania thermothiophila]
MDATALRTVMVRVFPPFAFGYFLSYLYRVVNSVIAPDLVRELGLDAADLGLLTSTYFLTFAAFQLPLGMLLDRFGPRRTEAVLLLFAAAGALLFALAGGLGGLVLGRALVGFGVSACLMAAFKAYVVWVPPARLPLVNGFQMAAGGLGALSATAPVQAALAVTDWRGVFLGLAALTLLCALLIFLVVPERRDAHHAEPLRAQLAGVAEVFTSATFWRIAPVTVLSQATFLAIQSLWLGPWLADVAGLGRDAAAARLALVAAAMVAGFIVIGGLAERLARCGVSTAAVAVAGMGAFMAVQLALVAPGTPPLTLLLVLFGLLGTSGIVSYAALSQAFPRHLAGRANTALNLLVFVAAFAAQWGMGGIINRWPAAGGGYEAAGYRAAFGTMLVLQLAALAWYAAAPRGVQARFIGGGRSSSPDPVNDRRTGP